jgi:hypothetical protein
MLINMENERLKQIIINAYSGQVNMQDAIDLCIEFMVETKGTVNQELVAFMSSHTNPIGMQMLTSAVDVAIKYFSASRICITKLLDKQGQLIRILG